MDDLFDDTPKGKYGYCNDVNPKVIAALLLPVAIGLIIGVIPALHEGGALLGYLYAAVDVSARIVDLCCLPHSGSG